MKHAFFSVISLDEALALLSGFSLLETEKCPVSQALHRILAEEAIAREAVPDFNRSTRDGFAVRARDTFGASENASPLFSIVGRVPMGKVPDFTLGPGQTATIATGAMLPQGADSVVMVEDTTPIDAGLVEIHRSVAPGSHVIQKGDDARQGQVLLSPGRRLKPQDLGFLSGAGVTAVQVRRQPRIAILSTGDEIRPPESPLQPGEIRDINTRTLAAMVAEQGGIPLEKDIVPDKEEALHHALTQALLESDLILVSGGSSVGTRDYAPRVIAKLPEAAILAHGLAIRPGKPTLIARVGEKALIGLPGHAASAALIFHVLVRPLIRHITGETAPRSEERPFMARLSRNLSSVQGRADYIRVRILDEKEGPVAEPLLGEAGLIRTLVEAQGLICIPRDTEGLLKDSPVTVHPL
ncbi:gephyrin-like molybdotransferase Glp [Desulfobotulus sp.]|jgi:molybdopterin molybdotransferase|uniref:molybdopterin molybdotransferase MoeA n=1 Tax=Desulfobotulus sp. TaxID=1940337 RepID=UPI002A3586E6|nr:gephyrin-like molybdotransferase Glp [Desulfobotulus sp.]MDY0163966.1 molybdopterin molybdotransferase MoeA [Desulfobotulus sp.]